MFPRQSSSKMRMIREGFAELYQKVSLLPMVFYINIDLPRFSYKFFVIINIKPSLIICHSIENFTNYKMLYKTLRKHFEVEFLVKGGIFLEKGAIY